VEHFLVLRASSELETKKHCFSLGEVMKSSFPEVLESSMAFAAGLGIWSHLV